MPEKIDITTENVFEVEIKKLALDERFGALKFEYALDKLLKIQEWLKEAHDLNYQGLLMGDDYSIVEGSINELVFFLRELQVFDISAVSNPKAEQDSFNQHVDNSYQEVYTKIAMRILPFLREEKRREDPEQQKLDAEVARISEIRSGLEKELEKAQNEISQNADVISNLNSELEEVKNEREKANKTRFGLENELIKATEEAKNERKKTNKVRSNLESTLEEVEKEKKQIEEVRYNLKVSLEEYKKERRRIRGAGRDIGSEKGGIAAVNLWSHFNNESKHYEAEADRWFHWVRIGYFTVVPISIILGGIISIAVMLFDANIKWQAVVSNSAIFIALWSALYFVVRNYNINSHLCSVNRHRAAVAKTLDDFIAVEQQEEDPRLSEVLQNASESMFKNFETGYMPKVEKDTGNSVVQIINDTMGSNKNHPSS